MATAAQRRLLKDLKRIEESGDQIIAMPLGNNLLKWSATIEGIDSTPWEGGLFQLKLDFTENYPNKPPNVKFISEMFHPNIYKDGRICLDMLQNQWSPVYDVWSILTAIRSLLADPNTLSPANMVASSIYKQNKLLYEQKVKQIVQKSLDSIKDDEELQKQSQSDQQQPIIGANVQIVQLPIIRASTINEGNARGQINNPIQHEGNRNNQLESESDSQPNEIQRAQFVIEEARYLNYEFNDQNDDDQNEDDNDQQDLQEDDESNNEGQEQQNDNQEQQNIGDSDDQVQ